jgi:hypothetical protein
LLKQWIETDPITPWRLGRNRQSMNFRPLWLDRNRNAEIWSPLSYPIMPFDRGGSK